MKVIREIKANFSLTEAILKQTEANIIKARAEENNSLASLNFSKVLLENEDLANRLIRIIEVYESK